MISFNALILCLEILLSELVLAHWSVRGLAFSSFCIPQLRAASSPVAEYRLPDNDNTHKKGKNPAICKACLATHINFSEALQPQEFEINGPDELTKNNAIIQA
uniref:Secreted protein n=1 Tax=Glossina austeni TaxID=7395 RepID=A0A1A9VAC5_GLOAU